MLQPLRNNPNRQSVVRAITYSASVEGWDAISPLAAMKELRAVQLKNWFPQPGYLEVRRGYQVYARLAASTIPIQSLMVYHGLSTTADKLFAAANGNIYDTSNPSAALSVQCTWGAGIWGVDTWGAPLLTSLASNRWQWVNYSNTGANYLYIVNGSDAAHAYNGTSWTTPTITGVSSTDLVHVNSHQRRLWFCQNNSTKAWYLGTDSISGAATAFELGSFFTKGGYLNAMATWTVDAGAGPDDYAVFISSRGQCAVYHGTDPSSSTTWALVGVYDLPAPIGRRCFVKYGGNLLLLTVSGLLQLNLALQSDSAQVQTTAITQRIDTAFNTAARLFKDNFGWDVTVYAKGTRMFVNIPTSELISAKQYVMNTITGAWCEYDNHNAACWAVYKDRIFFGGVDGAVYEADTTSADKLTPITATGQTAYKADVSPGNLKRFTMIQPLVVTSGSTRPSVGISTDFNETATLSTPSGAAAATSLWDAAVWDTAIWGGGSSYVSDWTSSSGLGRWASVKFQASTGTNASGMLWGTGQWGVDTWGESNVSEETIQVNGFVVLAEVGAYV